MAMAKIAHSTVSHESVKINQQEFHDQLSHVSSKSAKYFELFVHINLLEEPWVLVSSSLTFYRLNDLSVKSVIKNESILKVVIYCRSIYPSYF